MQFIQSKLNQHFVVAPQAFMRLFKRTPIRLQVPVVETVLNHVFADVLKQDELTFLVEKWLKVDIEDIDYQLFITNRNNVLKVTLLDCDVADVTFKAKTATLIQLMSRTVDPDTLFFKRELVVTGDTELGLEIKNLLDEMPLDALPKVAQYGLQAYVKLQT